MPDYTNLQQELKDVSQLLIALGDIKRQAIIIRLLEEKNCDGLQVGELTQATGLSRPAVSHHLKVLKDVGLINFHEVGTKNFYYLQHDVTTIQQLKDLLEEVADIMTKEP